MLFNTPKDAGNCTEDMTYQGGFWDVFTNPHVAPDLSKWVSMCVDESQVGALCPFDVHIEVKSFK